jgi:ribonuclease E
VSPPAYEAPSAYERETVSEFQPREAPPAAEPARPSGAGYAPAAPVKIEWPSDLQQVESDPEKVRAVQAQEVEPEPAPRPKRVRQQQAAVDEGPLVQVETGRDEKTPA